MHYLLVALIFITVSCPAKAQPSSDPPVKITPINATCDPPGTDNTSRPCSSIDALFFVHGIYGDRETFKNVSFDWPSEIANKYGATKDVYIVEYQTKLLTWLRKDVASFDEIAEAFFDSLQGQSTPDGRREGLLDIRPYRSVGFIAHSLGGNFVAAYIHWVKSELGHEDRAKNSFLITLGTPASGAQIANLGLILKSKLGMRDPLLKSLEQDNTFLRMLAAWRRAEDAKATRFDCRPVDLYVAVEGKNMLPGMRIVPFESAAKPYDRIARETKYFADYDHSRVAKPSGPNDPLYQWVDKILENEDRRIGEWRSERLCRRVADVLPPTIFSLAR